MRNINHFADVSKMIELATWIIGDSDAKRQ